MSYKVLIVEDDTSFGLMLRSWFLKNGYEATFCENVNGAKVEIKQCAYDLVMTDLRLPDGDGMDILSWMKEQGYLSTSAVVIMTSYGEVQSAVAAIKLGAVDYLEKPVNPVILKQKVEQILASAHHADQPVGEQKPPVETETEIVYGVSRATKQLYDYIKLVAPTNMSVLISGESGTGKEYAARMVHQLSNRKEAAFLAVDCGSLSRELAPSELFGHLKGSFTSAIADKKGVFEQADGGTVFLDEVGNLSYEVQMQLLRAIQERKIRPVGAASDIPVDVRIIAATNENLQDAIAEGRFREDLYHRLDEFPLTVPPLRQRPEDLALFARHFLSQANAELNKKVTGFSEKAMGLLRQYQWPGNLRELRNVIRRAVLVTRSNEITEETLPKILSESIAEESLALHSDKDEKQQIEEALRMAKGNKSKAARLLKIDRKTLYNKMHLYGMDL